MRAEHLITDFSPPFKSRGLVSCQVSSNLPAFVPLVSEAVAGCFCYMQMLMQKMKMTLKKNLIGVFFHNNYKDGVERKNVSYCKISKGRKRSFQVKYECIVHNFSTFYHTSLRITHAVFLNIPNNCNKYGMIWRKSLSLGLFCFSLILYLDANPIILQQTAKI